MILSRKVVSLLEILRAYADAYAKVSYAIGTAVWKLRNDPAALSDTRATWPMVEALGGFKEHCADLPITETQVDRVSKLLGQAQLTQFLGTTAASISERLVELQSRLEDELATKLFFRLPYERRRFYDQPYAGWEEILERFPGATSDVLEMSRCFALSRYPACVFHSMQVAEHGLIKLGIALRVKDPKPGWTATFNEIKRILKKSYESRTDWERSNFGFIEQMNGTVEALLTAWRHKIDHASGRLAVLPGDFSPEVAEDIMSATRAFMRRLATEMPMEIRPETDTL